VSRPEGALPPRAAALLFLLTASILLFRLGALPLIGPDEPRYARVAVEMLRSGDRVTPTLQGNPWLEKPPLYYWLAAEAFSFLGETELAARLPSVVAGLLFVGASALCAARLFGAAPGLHTGFILATALLPFAYGRAASMDMLLASSITASTALLALRILGTAGRLAVPLAWGWMALATLAKGPIGLLPAVVTVAWLVLTRDRRGLRDVASLWGVLLFLAISLPWYARVWLAQGNAFIEVFLLNHNLQRLTSTIHHHPGTPLFYIPIIIGGFFPWSGLLLPALGGLEPRRRRVDLFLLLWLLLPLLLFSLAGSKLPGYILPCMPPLAILMGRATNTLGCGLPPWASPRAAAWVTCSLGVLVAATPLVLFRLGEPTWFNAFPLSLWTLMVVYTFARRVSRDPPAALTMLRVGAAGFLLLLTLLAIPVLARRESGRELFRPARGREVLVWGAWRSAWMAGFFYNDGRVREVDGPGAILAATRSGPALVLCGPSERRRIESLLPSRVLARGPRENVLVEVAAPDPARGPAPVTQAPSDRGSSEGGGLSQRRFTIRTTVPPVSGKE